MATAKPVLRGLLKSQLKRDFAIATTICFVATAAWKVLVKDARTKRYEEFYKTFEPQEEFESMRNAGVFDSVKADGSVGEGGW